MEKTIHEIAPMASRYEDFQFLCPPRPEQKFPAKLLHIYDDSRFLGQPKLNGSLMLTYMNERSLFYTDRHNDDWTKKITQEKKFYGRPLYSGEGWMVLCGEWMEKSKKDEDGNNFNGNYVLFDILVYDGWLLTGSTFIDRLHLLGSLYKTQTMSVTGGGKLSHQEFLYQTEIDNVYRVRTFEKNFKIMYDALTMYDMYEGLVLKRRDAILQPPYSESANSKWCLKCRKETKIYPY